MAIGHIYTNTYISIYIYKANINLIFNLISHIKLSLNKYLLKMQFKVPIFEFGFRDMLDPHICANPIQLI